MNEAARLVIEGAMQAALDTGRPVRVGSSRAFVVPDTWLLNLVANGDAETADDFNAERSKQLDDGRRLYWYELPEGAS